MSLINLGHQGQPGSLDTSLFSTNTIPSSSILTSTANITNGVVILDSLDRLPIADGSRLLHVSASGINGITVTGTPSSGQVLTATSSIAADWQTPSTGGTPAGSTGAIQFSSNGVTFAADSSNLFWDKTNSRLGVGVNSPRAELHAYSDFGDPSGASGRENFEIFSGERLGSVELSTPDIGIDQNHGGPTLEINSWGATGGEFIAGLRGGAHGGTTTSPTATPGGCIFNIGLIGHDGSGYVGTRTRIQSVSEATWSPGNTPARITFSTTKSGHANVLERLRITHDGALRFSNPGQGGPAVSNANTGTIYYDSGTQTFQVSENGGPYTSLAVDLTNVSTNINVTDGHEYQIGGARAIAGSNRSEGLCVGNAGPADLLAGSNNNNTYVGNSAGASITTGNHNNVFLGANAGISQTGGDNNTYLGTQAGSDNNGNNNVFIGAGAGNGETTSSYRLIIAAKDNPFVPSGGALIYGEFDNLRVGIGQASAAYTLDVAGDVNVSGMYRVGGVQIASTNLSDGTTLTAASLKDSGGSVNVSSAAAPSTGQVLTATDATHATWQTPSVGTSAAGITGSVQFKSGGTFAANTANFFWDDGNTGLGVRTTSLFGGNGSASDGGTTALHVAGPSVFGGSIWVDGPNGIELTGGGTLHGSTGVPFGSDITVKGGASTSNGPGALILLQGSQASSGSKVSLRSSNGSNSTLESEFTIFGNDGGGGSNSFFFNAKTDFGSPTSPAYKFATGSNSEKMRLTFQGHLLVGTTTDSGYFISAAGDINSSTLYRIGGAPVLAVAGFSSNSILVGLQANSVGNQNVLLGYQVANGGNGTGNENVFIGYESAYFNSGGNFNTFVGASTGQGFGSVGEYNTYVGYESGLGQSGTTHNTFLGANSGRNSTGSAGSVFIGYKAGYSEVRSNKLYITNDDVPPLIYGEFDTNRVSIGGLTTSAYTLDVAGDINTSGVFRVNGTPISNPSFVDKETPSGTINSSNTVFTLAFTPTSNSEHVFLNGLLQDGGGNDYSITGPTITFTVAPTTGSRLRVSYRK